MFADHPDVHILLTVDEASYEGGTMGVDHPIAWHHEFNGGRAFYAALGHTLESYSEEAFLQHLHGGLLWVLGTETLSN